jgi:hypothetical protein
MSGTPGVVGRTTFIAPPTGILRSPRQRGPMDNRRQPAPRWLRGQRSAALRSAPQRSAQGSTHADGLTVARLAPRSGWREPATAHASIMSQRQRAVRPARGVTCSICILPSLPIAGGNPPGNTKGIRREYEGNTRWRHCCQRVSSLQVGDAGTPLSRHMNFLQDTCAQRGLRWISSRGAVPAGAREPAQRRCFGGRLFPGSLMAALNAS